MITVFALARPVFAFQTKKTSDGSPVRWAVPHVAFVIDPEVERTVPGGANAVATAMHGWAGVDEAPAFFAEVGATPGPAHDGKNTVSFAKGGFIPAGGPLAVTVVSVDDATGHIVDADVVLNGQYTFALVADGSRPGSDVRPISTDSTDDDGGLHGEAPGPFDLRHVVAHEFGHVLGLADEPRAPDALMYRFTWPGDASRLRPSSDDLAGVRALYPPPSAGCDARIAGRSPGSGSLPFLGAACVAAVLWRRRRVPLVLTVAFACAALTAASASEAGPESAGNARWGGDSVGDGRYYVASAETRDEGGLFRTNLRLLSRTCRRAVCPTELRVELWGGQLGGITQCVGGGCPPRAGEEIEAWISDVTAKGPPSSVRLSEDGLFVVFPISDSGREAVRVVGKVTPSRK